MLQLPSASSLETGNDLIPSATVDGAVMSGTWKPLQDECSSARSLI